MKFFFYLFLLCTSHKLICIQGQVIGRQREKRNQGKSFTPSSWDPSSLYPEEDCPGHLWAPLDTLTPFCTVGLPGSGTWESGEKEKILAKLFNSFWALGTPLLPAQARTRELLWELSLHLLPTTVFQAALKYIRQGYQGKIRNLILVYGTSNSGLLLRSFCMGFPESSNSRLILQSGLIHCIQWERQGDTGLLDLTQNWNRWPIMNFFPLGSEFFSKLYVYSKNPTKWKLKGAQ